MPLSLQKVDLILHKRDQRRHHDRQPIEEQRRQLVTETLARPGWKDGKRGPSGKKRLDDLFLAGTK